MEDVNIENSELFKKKLKIARSLSLAKRDSMIKVSYHGVSLGFFTNSKQLIEKLEKKLPADWFLNDEDEVLYEIFILSPEVFHINNLDWEDEGSQDCFLFEEGKVAVQRDFVAKEHSEKQIFVVLNEDLGDGLYNFLRWFLPRKLLKKNTYVLHCSSIVIDEKAYVFMGHSGAGKSTIANMAKRENFHVLGDDMNLLHQHSNGEVKISAGAIGGNFYPDVNYNRRYPIAEIFWIIQSDRNDKVELDKPNSILKLTASITNIFWEKLNEVELQQVLESVTNITEKKKVSELFFQKTPEVFKILS